MDEIERLFNNIVKLFNSVNIYKKKKKNQQKLVSIYAEKFEVFTEFWS